MEVEQVLKVQRLHGRLVLADQELELGLHVGQAGQAYLGGFVDDHNVHLRYVLDGRLAGDDANLVLIEREHELVRLLSVQLQD